MELRERKKALILGATSSIAQAVARELARMDYDFHLVARDRERLKAVGDDLRARSACRCSEQVFDLVETERHSEVLEGAKEALGGLDLALIAYGTMGSVVSAAGFAYHLSKLHWLSVTGAGLHRVP